MKTVTKEWLLKYTSSEHTGINSSQCIILGFEFKDLRRGWVSRVEGMVLSNASAELFELLHGVAGKKKQSVVISDFKSRKEDRL